MKLRATATDEDVALINLVIRKAAAKGIRLRPGDFQLLDERAEMPVAIDGMDPWEWLDAMTMED